MCLSESVINELKEGYEDVGMSFSVIPSLERPDGYAQKQDIIAYLEEQIVSYEFALEELEAAKKGIDTELKMKVEELADDKNAKLTNQMKMDLKYIELASEHEYLKELETEIKVFRLRIKKLKIELGNEQRAYQLELRKNVSCQACGGDMR